MLSSSQREAFPLPAFIFTVDYPSVLHRAAFFCIEQEEILAGVHLSKVTRCGLENSIVSRSSLSSRWKRLLVWILSSANLTSSIVS